MSEKKGTAECNKFFFVGPDIATGTRVYVRETLEQGGAEELHTKLTEAIHTGMKNANGNGNVLVSLACEACGNNKKILEVNTDREYLGQALIEIKKEHPHVDLKTVDDLIADIANTAAMEAIKEALMPSPVAVLLQMLSRLGDN